MSLLFAAYCATLLLAHYSQYTLARPLRPENFSPRVWLTQSLLFSSLYISALILTQRPLLASIITLAVLVVLLVVNHAKYHALQEPLVYSDIYLYLQVFSHPRLFLPFLNLPLTISAILIGLSLLSLALWLEPSVYREQSVSVVLGGSVGLLSLLTSCILLLKQLAPRLAQHHHSALDIPESGFYTTLLSHALQALPNDQLAALQQTLQQQSPWPSQTSTQSTANSKDAQLPDIIVIQSESFFDARRLYANIRPELFSHFDQLVCESLAHGQLTVPSWGANTLRPEFAFLSGIDNQQLGLHRFNPYQFLQQQAPTTLASHLRAMGYRCIALHPNNAAFFKRDRVFPLFGFEEFIDIHDFKRDDTAGPYISDAAVQRKITELLKQHKAGHDPRPLCMFVITMENHGPLHLESYEPQEVAQYYTQAPPAHDDLTVYLRHLHNHNRMLGELRVMLQQRDRDSLLCFYGDHVPSMPQVYQALDFRDGRTDYFIWHSSARTASAATELAIHQLSPLVAEIALSPAHQRP